MLFSSILLTHDCSAAMLLSLKLNCSSRAFRLNMPFSSLSKWSELDFITWSSSFLPRPRRSLRNFSSSRKFLSVSLSSFSKKLSLSALDYVSITLTFRCILIILLALGSKKRSSIVFKALWLLTIVRKSSMWSIFSELALKTLRSLTCFAYLPHMQAQIGLRNKEHRLFKSKWGFFVSLNHLMSADSGFFCYFCFAVGLSLWYVSGFLLWLLILVRNKLSAILISRYLLGMEPTIRAR